MNPLPPNPTRVKASPESSPESRQPAKFGGSSAGELTGRADLPTQSRTMGDHVIRLDEADAPTALPAEVRHGVGDKSTAATQNADELLIHLGSYQKGQVDSPATWLGAHGYRIDRLLGRGGYGEVYLADHPKLVRQVAIKVPRADVVLTADFKRRFLDEANIVAQLDHPNIVTIYDMIAEPYPAIIYEYCGNGTLQDLQPVDGIPLDESAAVKLFTLLAGALAFAHNRGVLHRDIKPSNILIQKSVNRSDSDSFFWDGRWWTPKLADFGLAKVFGDGHTETASGMVAGTPEYMSPEQAIGRSRDIGTFSDTFSLGVVIYRVLIGHVPFPMVSRMGAIAKIENGDYVIPRRARPELSADIEAVIVKSLRPSPSDRYRDAADLLDDLQRLQAGNPVLARPFTWRDRLAQTVRRYPVTAVSTLFTLVGLLIVVAMIWRTSQQQRAVIAEMEAINRELAAAIVRTELSEQAEVHQRLISEKLRYASEMRLCQESFVKGDIKGYQTLLENHIPTDGRPDHRGFSWYWLWEQGHTTPNKIDRFPSAAHCVKFSPDGHWLAACGADGSLRLYATADWSMRRILFTNQGEVNGLSFSSNGTLIATAGDDGTAKIWDWIDGRLVTTIKCHSDIAYSARFMNHDTKLVTCGNESEIRIWDLVGANSLLTELVAHTDAVESFHISEDEKYLVSAGSDGARIVWDLESYEPISLKKAIRSQRTSDVVIVPNDGGVRFFSASLSGGSGQNALLMLEESGTDFRRALLASTSGIQSISSSSRGNLVAVGDRDGGVTLLDVSEILANDAAPDATSSIIGRWTGHTDRVYCVSFSPDGKHLVTCGKDGNVFRWEPAANQRVQYAEMTDVDGAMQDERWTAIDYADDCKQVFAVTNSRGIDRWDVRENKITRLCKFEAAEMVEGLVVDDDGTCLFMSDGAGGIQRFNIDPETGAVVLAWQQSTTIDSPPRSCDLALSKDGKILAAAYSRNRYSLALFDATSGELLATHRPKNWLPTDSFGIALSPYPGGRDYGRVAYSLGGDVIVVDWVADESRGAESRDAESRSAESHSAKVRFVDEQRLKTDSDTVQRIVFQNHSTMLGTTTQNQLIKWDLNYRSEPELFSGQPRPLKILMALPDDREVWTTSGRHTLMTWCMHTSNSLVEVPIVEMGAVGSIRTVGREVTGYVNGRKLFWQPLLISWPEELKRSWTK